MLLHAFAQLVCCRVSCLVVLLAQCFCTLAPLACSSSFTPLTTHPPFPPPPLPGAYEHFPDPLELTGFIGAELASGERVFNLDALVACGVVMLAPEQEDAYHSEHCTRILDSVSHHRV